MKNNLLLILFIFMSVLLLNGVFSIIVTSPASLLEKNASICLNESKIIMNDMVSQGFNVQRVNDTLKEATLIYNSQVILQSRKMNYDFSLVLNYCNEIKKIKSSSIEAKDQFDALVQFRNNTDLPSSSSVKLNGMIQEISDEIQNERYENVPEMVQKVYDEISAVRASSTFTTVLYQNTTKNLLIHFKKNWRWEVPLATIVIIFLIIYRIRISKWIIFRKIERLKVRKKTIKELMMETQKSYFQYAKIPEGEYNIKTKKFAELIRDIDRQIPLLQEELARLDSKKHYKF
jgi:hypothetical protein